jgi:hypothetical protein
MLTQVGQFYADIKRRHSVRKFGDQPFSRPFSRPFSQLFSQTTIESYIKSAGTQLSSANEQL